MRGTARNAVIGSTLLLAACAVHPLPEDVTRENTYHIVQKIRCEARDAITKLAVSALRESYYPPTLALADRVESGELTVTDLFQYPQYSRDVDPQVHRNFDIFGLSAVGLAFTFTISENNDNSGNANFRMPLTSGLFTLGIQGGNTLNRQNERKLTTSHTFLDLYELTDRDVCSGISAGGGNLIYPITGKIGLDEVFYTFYLLNRPPNDNLRSPPDEAYKNRLAGHDVTDFSDSLMFTTKFNASVNPSIQLDPVPAHEFRLANASATSAAYRQDIHKLAISVEIGKPVVSLAQARGLIGLRAAAPAAQRARIQTLQRLYDLRRDDFFSGVRQERMLLGLPPL